jgi:glycopeptide antibiotics resistance protein
VHKNIFLVAALFWTGVIFYFCLREAKDIPQMVLPFGDKVVHSVFHFVFTTLWFLYFKKKWRTSSKVKLFICSFVFSLLLGISIEFMQHWITLTRSADAIDVLANVLGATLAVIVLNSCNEIIDKI